MKLSLTAWLAIALALSLVGNAAQLYLAGGQKPKCELKQANDTIKASDQLRTEEAARDQALDDITWETRVDTTAAVTTTEKKTHERAAQIDAVPLPAGPGCDAPLGLPDLGPAVDQANAAAGH